MILLFEGPDNSGKSTIAKEISKELSIPYFKNPQEHRQKSENETYLVTRYAGTYFADFIRFVPINVIIDRHYPSEYVYGQVEGREMDLDILRYIDDSFSVCDVKIVICMRDNYKNIQDVHANSEKLEKIAEKYYEFIKWTNVQTLLLNTTNEDIENQIVQIKKFIR